MSIAFAALILAVILFPGAAVLGAYYTSVSNRSSAIQISFPETLFRGLFWSLIIHCIGINLLPLLGYTVELEILYRVITGKEIDAEDIKHQELFSSFSFYILGVTLTTFLLTKLIKNFIHKNLLDLKFYSLRKANFWFQLFSGRNIDFSGYLIRNGYTGFVLVEVVTKGGSAYEGFLFDYSYQQSTEKVEYIVLQEVIKEKPSPVTDISKQQDAELSSPYPDTLLVIPIAEISNLSITYCGVQKEDVQKVESSN